MTVLCEDIYVEQNLELAGLSAHNVVTQYAKISV